MRCGNILSIKGVGKVEGFLNRPLTYSHLQHLPQDNQGSTFQAPITAFTFKMPPDGLPVLEDWLVHVGSILSLGYESWRESVELKPVHHDQLGKPLDFGVVEPTKGSGRISMLLFIIWYSYIEMKQVLKDHSDERTEFKEQLVWKWLNGTKGDTWVALRDSISQNFQG